MNTMRHIASAPSAERDAAYIYPELPTAVKKEQEQYSTSFHLKNNDKLQKQLEGGKVARATLLKKKKKIRAWTEYPGWGRHRTAGHHAAFA